MRIRQEIIRRHFELAAKAMGWDIAGPQWIGQDERGSIAKVGHVRLDKRGRADRWEIVYITNDRGGEHTIRYVCSGAEMFAWLEGVQWAARELEGRRINMQRRTNGHDE